MTAACCADRRRAGFTLIELLVSMVVLSLVAVTMMSGLRFVIRTFEHTDSRRAALEELTLGFSVLRNELERAEPLMRKINNEDRVLFEGASDRVRFVNVEPPYLAGRPYLMFEYAITGQAGDYRIELRRAAYDPAAPDLDAVAEAEPRVVLRVPQPLQFTYWGQARKDERARWSDSWSRKQQLPMAVRLAAGEDPGWPDLVVPLQIRVPWYCATGQQGGGQLGSGTPGSGLQGSGTPGSALQGGGQPSRNAGCEVPS